METTRSPASILPSRGVPHSFARTCQRRAAVAQLVRAPDCGSGGRWFDSTQLYHLKYLKSVTFPCVESAGAVLRTVRATSAESRGGYLRAVSGIVIGQRLNLDPRSASASRERPRREAIVSDRLATINKRARSCRPIPARGSPCAPAPPRRAAIPCQSRAAESRFRGPQRARHGCPPLRRL
jgi:hypothetical protein